MLSGFDNHALNKTDLKQRQPLKRLMAVSELFRLSKIGEKVARVEYPTIQYSEPVFMQRFEKDNGETYR
ncbi:hypothetical protein LPH50_06910 [Xylella taiwanensis]|uniref:Uncharacterized protein n=1 Tax=Xylella taiwanensis TaxID=1444770 RepID=A0ABS8TSF0_9GAMM|nr:hypothetical protein [Xylella taiwanensis]MCD8455687.1 hypothetical protein [Xylella taiwanensis]MCD8458094.1 hypothetical protein [Xylella taiwanensis]MCD8460229.1 hypothetical protein [Xylella taiwanensis]MCD8463713.1 hypothetical protein [Xylella taiwanensis]MCD8464731.1 hypothetical protein [Xylella taiwanensis]